MSIWPAMIDRLFCRPSARTLALANLTYVILTLGSVWVVAYNFVPGGEYTRERTDVLLGVAMAFVGLAMMTRCKPDENELYSKSKKEDLPCNEEKPSCSEVSKGRRFNNVAFPIVKANKFAFYSSHVKPAMFFLVLVTAGIMAFRHQNLNKKPPVKEDPRVFSAMIWTVHFGYDNKGWPSFERAAQMINDTGVDVVGFLESDCSKSYLGSHDLPGWFEERLGMHADFGPSTRDHTWGATLLSKYPIVSSQHHLLPSPEGELAPAVSATINITGSLVDFVVVHMGNDRDDLDRQLQAQELARIMDESPNPVVFLGYVTSAPGSRDYNVLLKKGRVKDIDSTDRHRWCEYIMYRGLTRLGYARISHGGLSDTEVQMARFRLPADGERYKDNDKMTTSPRAVPRNLHFTDRFGSYYAGHYYGEHHYHMSTPKYFLPE
ncbi:predicted protein [Nematostella vectensis]|uniref:PGAP2-interacting protein n=1 Tax=Nematostella vectensis TaxID=45351 RepID=A7RKW4_NEMVE|nr:predicted protein [Nematostella vectensis]|eukprot:XP_001639893.1 predicted protein [Nematostella vectensis]